MSGPSSTENQTEANRGSAAADPPRRKGYFWLLPLVLFVAFLTAWGILFWIAAEHRPKEVPRASEAPAPSP